MPSKRIATTAKEKKAVKKVKEQDRADELMSMLNEYMNDLKEKTLASLVTQPSRDIECLQAEYRAGLKLVGWLRTKVNEGKVASHNLRRGE